MKRMFSGIAALAMLAALAAPVSASAEERGAVISTEIQPTYLVSIPTDMYVVQNQENAAFGTIKLDQAQLEPMKCVKVSLISDGLLKHQQDNSRTLAYTVRQKDEAQTVFTSAAYQNAGEKTDLTIGIKKEDWESAFAGVYRNTVTFRIEYTDQSAT